MTTTAADPLHRVHLTDPASGSHCMIDLCVTDAPNGDRPLEVWIITGAVDGSSRHQIIALRRTTDSDGDRDEHADHRRGSVTNHDVYVPANTGYTMTGMIIRRRAEDIMAREIGALIVAGWRTA